MEGPFQNSTKFGTVNYIKKIETSEFIAPKL